MEKTEQALSAIREEWLAQGSPPVAQVAQRANMPAITARRYLDGSTKFGDPAKIRALAIALGRSDIADTVRDVVSADLSDSIMKFMAEKFLLWRESNLEELAIERKAREESEKRYAAEIERIITSKDRVVDQLNTRIDRLEADKAELIADKAQINAEMISVRSTKRKHDAYLILSLVGNITLFVIVVLYLVFIDAPNGSIGVIRY